MNKNTKALKEIHDELLAATDAPLYAYRTENNYFPVIGEGNHAAEVMFIGEAPGKNEAEQGKPFCGRSGKILDELLASIELPRESVYITNIVKDRPPENRDPTQEEISWYAPYLDRQIDIIQPKVIATLGRFSMSYLFDRYGVPQKHKGISELHGTAFEAATDNHMMHIVALYHPAAAIYNQALKQTLIDDMRVLASYI